MARRRKKKSGGKSEGKGGGGLIPGFTGGSARSKGLIPFGFISGAKKSKSKRSRGVSLGAGTLSKKGGSGPATKRSTGLPAPGTATSVSPRKGMLSTKRSKGAQAVAGRDITTTPTNRARAGSMSTSPRITNRSKAVSTKQRSSGGSKQKRPVGVSGQASISNKATERSKLKKKR